jgi:transcriptional regulator with XRE-family HTH domain
MMPTRGDYRLFLVRANLLPYRVELMSDTHLAGGQGPEPRDNWRLSDTVAERISILRRRRDLNREQLAERCAKLGYPALTAPALANIETGRRDKAGRRRRDVTVDELVVLAAALRVPPLLLMFPIGEAQRVEVLPGRRNTGWDAAKWFIGELPESVAEYEEWARSAAALSRHRQHDEWAATWLMLTSHIEDAEVNLRGEGDDARRASYQERWDMLTSQRSDVEDRWREVRLTLRQLGLTPPPLPPGADAVDA